MWASIYVHECVQRRLALGVTAAAVAHRIRTLEKHLGRVSAGGLSLRTAGSCTRTRYCHTTSRRGPGCGACPTASPPGSSANPRMTIRETAALAGVPRTAIEKAVEARVPQPLTAPARLRGGAMRYLPIRAVVYFRAPKAAKLTDLPLRHKRSIWTRMARLEPMKLVLRQA